MHHNFNIVHKFISAMLCFTLDLLRFMSLSLLYEKKKSAPHSKVVIVQIISLDQVMCFSFGPVRYSL